MGFIIFIAIIALWVWYKKSHYNDDLWVKERVKNRTPDQQAVIRYFCNEPACLSKKPISDTEYEEMLNKFLKSTDFKQKALNKIGLDEDQVKEIEPVHFEGYVYGPNERNLAKQGEDKKWRSSKYQISWLFCSDTQVYIYQYAFFLDEDGREERTQEYFYKDITNFSTTSGIQETPKYDPKEKKEVLVNVNINRFDITVPGDHFYCSLEENDNAYTESAIQGMKAKLREKKSAS